MSVQVPAVRKLAVVPDTTQTAGVLEVKVIAPFDGELAFRLAFPRAVCGPRGVKLMVSAARLTVTLCDALAAW